MNQGNASTTEQYHFYNWVMEGRMPPRDYLESLIKGDVGRALNDFKQERSVGNKYVGSWVQATIEFMRCHLPDECWGTEEKAQDWAKIGGYEGLNDQEKIVAKLSGGYDIWLEMRHWSIPDTNMI